MKKVLSFVLTVAILALTVFSFTAFAESDAEQYLYKEGAGNTTGWWFHDGSGIRTTNFINMKFTAKGNVNGFTSFFYASQTAVSIKCSLLTEDGTEITSKTIECAGDAAIDVTFDKVAPAGVLILRFESLTDADGSHCVIASADAPDSGAVAEIECSAATNEATKAAPYVVLKITNDAPVAPVDPGNPGTSDTAVVIIAVVASIALAGAVVCKKVRA